MTWTSWEAWWKLKCSSAWREIKEGNLLKWALPDPSWIFLACPHCLCGTLVSPRGILCAGHPTWDTTHNFCLQAFQSKDTQPEVSGLNSFDKAEKYPEVSPSSILFFLRIFCLEFQLLQKHVWSTRMTLCGSPGHSSWGTITCFAHLWSSRGIEPQDGC